MGLPGHRRTSSDKRRRASHFALKVSSLTRCSHCKQPLITHQACSNCGYYRGRQVVVVKSKIAKRAKKAKLEPKEAEAKKAE